MIDEIKKSLTQDLGVTSSQKRKKNRKNQFMQTRTSV